MNVRDASEIVELAAYRRKRLAREGYVAALIVTLFITGIIEILELAIQK